MSANLDKFQAIISTKDKRDTVGLQIRVGTKVIKTTDQVIQLGVTIDNKLRFNFTNFVFELVLTRFGQQIYFFTLQTSFFSLNQLRF